MRRKLALVAALVVAAGTLTACSTRAPSDEIILYYKAGSGDDKKFVQCIEPGTSGKYPVDDEIYALPTSARNWVISADDDAKPDSKVPIKSGTKPTPTPDGKSSQPGAEVAIYTTTDFYLNTDCSGKDSGKDSPVVKFWEKTGRRYKVSGNGESDFSESKWKEMLQKTLVVAQAKALRTETRRYTADELDANLDNVWQKIERQLGKLFNDELNAKLGGSEYFCGPEFSRQAKGDVKDVNWTEYIPQENGEAKEQKKSGKCPPVRISITDINFADSGVAKARADVFKAQQKAKEDLVKAQSDAAVAAAKGALAKDPAYIRLRELEINLELAKACASNPNCTVIAGVNGNVNLPAGK